MRSPHLQRPPLPAATFLAVVAGLLWLAAIVARALDVFGLSWWVVLSPPLLVGALFVLYVAGALAVTLYYAVTLAGSEWWEARRRRAEARRIKEFFDRGHHLQDRRDDWYLPRR